MRHLSLAVVTAGLLAATVASCRDLTLTAAAGRAAAPPRQVDRTVAAGRANVCHASGQAEDPTFVALPLPAQAFALHFDEFGNPQPGHELDYLVTERTPCPPPDEPGVLKICKVNEGGIPAGTPFSFLVNGEALTVNTGTCTTLPFRVGTHVTVSETVPSTTTLADVTLTPSAAGSLGPATGSASVVVGTDVATLVYTNRSNTLGDLKVCKTASTGVAAGTPFTFAVLGQTYSVPAGATFATSCVTISGVTPGTIRVQETSTAGTKVVAIGLAGSGGIAASSLADAWVDVIVTAGQTAAINFTNQSTVGQLKVCKTASTGVAVGTSFTFTVLGNTYSIPAGATFGTSCITINGVPVGVVRVQETLIEGISVVAIGLVNVGSLVGSNLAAGWADMEVSPGGTSAVNFTNRSTVGTLKVCKTASTGIAVGTPFTFTILGKTYTVPAGATFGTSCVTITGVPEGTVRVQETPIAGTEVVAIGLVNTGSLLGSSLAERWADVGISAGQISAINFTNRAQ